MGCVVMKSAIQSFKFTTIAFLVTLAISLSPVVFGKNDKDTQEENTQASTDCKMKAYTDPEVMAAAMLDPAKFMELMALMSNPQTTSNMMECGLDTNQWNEIIANMTNPAKMMNAMVQFMNPQMYVNWMNASMNPAFYQSMNGFMNPALYMQWMTASMNPQFYAPMYKTMDPKWQQEATAWMMDSSNFQQIFDNMFKAPVIAEAPVTE